MFFKSCYVDAITVIIFSFIIRIKILITHLFQKLIYEIQNNLHQLTTHMSTLIMWHNRFRENENEAVEAHVPRHRDSKTRKPRHREREKLTHDIVIPRHFFRGQKATTSKFQGWKTTTSSFRGILTLMPPDTKRWLGTMSILHKKISGGYVAIKVGLMRNCPRYRHYEIIHMEFMIQLVLDYSIDCVWVSAI